MRSSNRRVAIVGAGAAGLATAIFLRRLDPSLSVTLLDGAARPGAKILVSGGSRCNVTNASVSERDFWGGRSTIVRRVLRAFPAAETVEWFDSIGVGLHEEAHGKLFPNTNRSRDVLDALLRELHASGAVLSPGTRVTDVVPSGEAFTLHTAQGQREADLVVLATGGQSLPKTGSDGGGLAIARQLGHTIVPTTPALAPLMLDPRSAFGAHVQGVAQDVELSIWIDDAIVLRLSGALLWTHFGVSGPVVLDGSRHWLRAELESRTVRVTINLVPGDTFDDVDTKLTRLAASRPRTLLQTAVAELLPSSVASAALQRLQLDETTPLAQLTRVDRRRLARALIEWPLGVTGSRGYNYAEATAGGVALEEIDPATMASRQCKSLHLVGEMLDVDGRIGGFNFQWAWSSARAAARGIAETKR